MRTATPQKKGPAKAATFPDHGSTNPKREKEMNGSNHITPPVEGATKFPIPYASQHPGDDLHSTMNMLDLVLESMEDDKRASPAFSTLSVSPSQAPHEGAGRSLHAGECSLKELSPDTFDRTVAVRTEKLWGAPAIARAMGVSVDTVRKWAKERSVPIYNPRPRTYFAYRGELEKWLRTKAA